ncbi:MAG: Cj0069 family protein [Pseudomonadota bacterium]|nr:Cj0069 family protein [Pseudomonadota bacterium]
MKKSIVFFEVKGGNDKNKDGLRGDTMPMISALKKKGWHAEQLFYSNSDKEKILKYVKENFSGYVSRINPGNIKDGEENYMSLLQSLTDFGLKGFPDPKTMTNFGCKGSLVKLADSDLVHSDTYAYYNKEDFAEGLAMTLSYGERVIKKNRGSAGEGIWRIQVIGDNNPRGMPYPLDTMVKCTEAVDNHIEEMSLGNFINYCEKYFEDLGASIVDMRYLPRIMEGEVRILLVGSEPIFVVHKKPKKSIHAFSATLFSGANYRYDSPQKWQKLVDMFNRNLTKMNEKIGVKTSPLFWTADFILDIDNNKEDIFILSEINCSCVGFTSNLDLGIQDIIADKIIESFAS